MDTTTAQAAQGIPPEDLEDAIAITLASVPAISGVYLIHLDEPYYHARHYVGFADNTTRRIDTHRRGHGSPLLATATAAGVDWRVVQI